jgi:hypothetical protein
MVPVLGPLRKDASFTQPPAAQFQQYSIKLDIPVDQIQESFDRAASLLLIEEEVRTSAGHFHGEPLSTVQSGFTLH